MSREDQHFRLRLPAEIRARLEESAAEHRRSITAEILDRLERSYQPADIADFPEMAEQNRKLDEIIRSLQGATVLRTDGKEYPLRSESAPAPARKRGKK